MRLLLALLLLLVQVTVGTSGEASTPGHSRAERKIARRQTQPKRAHKPPKDVRLGLIPHHKGVPGAFWNIKPIPTGRQDLSQDGTWHGSIPLQ